MKQSVLFVVLTYQPEREKLLKHLQSFKGLSYVLVDNSETAYKYPQDISVIRTKKNLGYAGGMNRGIRYCMEQGATWVVVTNDDLDVKKESLRELTEKLNKEPSGIVGLFVGTLDPIRWTSIYPLQKSSSMMYVSGSCMAIHSKTIQSIGLFNEAYFIYYEDVEYCLQAKKSGFTLKHIEAKGFKHIDGSTFKNESFLHTYYLARNHLLFVERNAPMGVKIHEFFRLPKTIWEHVKKKEWGALVGIRDYFLRRFGKYTPLW